MNEEQVRMFLSNMAYQLVLKNKSSLEITLTMDTGENITFQWRLKDKSDFPKLINMMTGKP